MFGLRGGKEIIYFKETGDKEAPAIVFIHGAGMGAWAWQRQLEHFSDYHCMAVDLPEHGHNVDSRIVSLRNCADQVTELIESRAKGGRAHVVGHSFGAKVTAELLATKPQVVDHAVLASVLYRRMALMRLFHRRWIYDFYAGLMRNAALSSLVIMFFKFPDEYYLENGIASLRSINGESLFKMYDEYFRYSKLPESLAKTYVPTLAIAGEKEFDAIKKTAASIKKLLPKAETVIFENQGHTYPWMEPEAFNYIVRSWIEDKELAR